VQGRGNEALTRKDQQEGEQNSYGVGKSLSTASGGRVAVGGRKKGEKQVDRGKKCSEKNHHIEKKKTVPRRKSN